MKSGFLFLVLTIFVVGFFLTGLAGTSSAMTFIWPAYFLIGVAGVLSIGALFTHVRFSVGRWTTLSLLLLVGYLLFRASESPVAYFAREDVGLIVTSFLAYVGVLILFNTLPSRRALLLSLAVLVGVHLVYAGLQTFVDPKTWIIPGYERTDVSGAGGLFNQPDHFAIYLAVLLPFWLSMLVFGREDRGLRWLWSALAVVSAGVILLSGNIGGMIVGAAGVSCFFLLLVFVVWKRLKPGVRTAGRFTLVLATIGLLAVLVSMADPLGRHLGSGSIARSDSTSLVEVWKAGAKQALESPWIGTGSRSTYIYGRLHRSPELGPEIGEAEFVHNEYLQVAADYGLAGLFLVLLVLALHLGRGMRFLAAFQHTKGPNGALLPRSFYLAQTAGAIASLAGLALSACFDFTLHLPAFAIIAAICLALLANPDPIARVFPRTSEERLLPGGGALFALRGIGFGCGLALVLFGSFFSRSEYHYEMARIAFEGDRRNFRQFSHLQEARRLDPANPYVFSLSAHAQVAGITPEMALQERRQALEAADRYFDSAYQLYPQDVFAAIGHAAVLDELGETDSARDRIAEAREWAPLYGNLMLAEAEHHLRRGDVLRAEESFRSSLRARAFLDETGAEEGLRAISEWKLIAQREGLEMGQPDNDSPPANRPGLLPEAKITERDLAGQVEKPVPAAPEEPKPTLGNSLEGETGRIDPLGEIPDIPPSSGTF